MTAKERVQHLTDIFLLAKWYLEELDGYALGEGGARCYDETAPYDIFAGCSHLLYSLHTIDKNLLVKPDEVYYLLLPDLCQLSFEHVEGLPYREEVGISRPSAERTDAYERTKKNLLKWFEFWFSVLQLTLQLDVREEFSETVRDWLDFQKDPDCDYELLDKKEKAIARVFTNGIGPDLMYNTRWILKDIGYAVIQELAEYDPTDYIKAYLEVLACQLDHIRRVIIWQTTAGGQYVLYPRRGWGSELKPSKSLRGGTPGVLTCRIRSRRKEITCEFTENSATKARTNWVIPLRALYRTCYDNELFATWSYYDGTHVGEPLGSEGSAFWIVETEEASNLDTIAFETDFIIRKLKETPEYKDLATKVERAIRNNASKWMPCRLPWTYVRELDELAAHLRRKDFSPAGKPGPHKNCDGARHKDKPVEASPKSKPWKNPGDARLVIDKQRVKFYHEDKIEDLRLKNFTQAHRLLFFLTSGSMQPHEIKEKISPDSQMTAGKIVATANKTLNNKIRSVGFTCLPDYEVEFIQRDSFGHYGPAVPIESQEDFESWQRDQMSQ